MESGGCDVKSGGCDVESGGCDVESGDWDAECFSAISLRIIHISAMASSSSKYRPHIM